MHKNDLVYINMSYKVQEEFDIVIDIIIVVVVVVVVKV
jgi:hypothetical protein